MRGKGWLVEKLASRVKPVARGRRICIILKELGAWIKRVKLQQRKGRRGKEIESRETEKSDPHSSGL